MFCHRAFRAQYAFASFRIYRASAAAAAEYTPLLGDNRRAIPLSPDPQIVAKKISPGDKVRAPPLCTVPQSVLASKFYMRAYTCKHLRLLLANTRELCIH